MSASAGTGGNDFSHRQIIRYRLRSAVRMGRKKSTSEAHRKAEKSRLVVFGAVYDCLMHQCAFEEAVRALKSAGILTAFRPTANRFVRAMGATPEAAAYCLMPPSSCTLELNTDPCRPFLAT